MPCAVPNTLLLHKTGDASRKWLTQQRGNGNEADVGAVGRAKLTFQYTEDDSPRWPPPSRRSAPSVCPGNPASAHARLSSGCRPGLQVALGCRKGGGVSGSLCTALRGSGCRPGSGRSWPCCRRPAAHLLPRQRAALLKWLPLPVLWQLRLPRVRLNVKRSPICGSSILSPS